MPFIWVILWAFTALWSQPPQYLPVGSDTLNTIRHTGYTLHYVERYEQPDWVAYDLTSADTRGTAQRADRFRSDPAVRSGSSTPEDYRGSGYDRGHLAPAGDMKWSATAMDESFFMSNMSPQAPAFNRGIWNQLEGQVRTWGRNRDRLRIVTGPILRDGPYTTIGGNQVAVPKRYYKVIYDPARKQAIGFVIPNAKGEGKLSAYEVTVDTVEQLTGLDFFSELPDSLEARVESSIDREAWPLPKGR